MVISQLVQEGTAKRAFQAGVTVEDFDIHDEEFQWVVDEAEKRRPINARRFKTQFPSFDFMPSQEKLTDLLDELKQERAFTSISAALDSVLVDLEPSNALIRANELREILRDVLRTHSAAGDTMIRAEWEEHYKGMKELQILSDSGEIIGIPTEIPHLDAHWGGLVNATTYVVLGRPGDAKSFLLAKFAAEAMWHGYRVGLFSPEMTEHQHRARINTLLSAKPEIQAALGMEGAFRNRALKDGRGFNLKSYRRFLEYVESEVPGEIALFTQKYRRSKMTAQYIESRVEDLGIDLVLVDPIYKLQASRLRKARFEELQDIVDALQDISQGFNIPVVMTNQATRSLVGTKGDPPTKDTSYGSDAPAQEADCVIGVKHHSEDRLMMLNCSKNRHGEPFRFKMKFHPNIGVMQDLSPLSSEMYYNGYDPEKAEELREALKEVETE